MNHSPSRRPFLRPQALKLLVPACGGLGLFLRLTMLRTGVDSKGLLVSNHPAWIGLWVLFGATVLMLVLCTRPIHGPAAYRTGFPTSLSAVLGSVLAAAGTAYSAWTLWQAGSPLFAAAAALAGLSFLAVAVSRMLDRKPNFLLHVVICVHFALEMLRLYQTWSFDPQIQDYCFQLFACIALTMTAYHLALFGIGKGSHRLLWAWGLAAVFLCCVSLDSGSLYLTSGIWAFTNLSNLKRPHRYLRTRRKAAPAQAEENG